ncbi:phosphatidylserine decarboxylase [Paenibacillus aquistagni]|uniref:phosphatidylserine decarboxylase n=2 Tax=Paenibacillus aquistagni TaxID=1852522 RepID=A0A1X7LSS6_9BACL|nr:phosphatidylserine decarboxylase [Paenibacillus aquistagni]
MTMMKRLLRLLTELSSRKWVSRITGSFASSRLSRKLIPTFARSYGIDIEEAEKHISAYKSLNDFFTRRLKPGSRMIAEGTDLLISPVDALITGMGPIEDGLLLNVKGQDYTLKELLNQSPHLQKYKRGYYFVLYLSPTDYHRIHAPVAGHTVESEHVLGKVYPVNDFGLKHMPRVLSRNERLITYIRHAYGEVSVVKVGALNVSSIRYADGKVQDQYDQGAELAYFEFGSTVVLLTENHTFDPRHDLKLGDKVKMGESLGQLHPKPAPEPKA